MRKHLMALIGLVALVAVPAPVRAQAPGGFVEKQTDTQVRSKLTASQISALLPTRGAFTFPSPYGTRGSRITNSTDCGGANCVIAVGYSYWRRVNNHAGSNTLWVMITLNRNQGGGGPTLFSYDKSTGAVTKVGPLFDATSPYSWDDGEGWYFSATQPNTLYIDDGTQLLRYDVVTKQFQTVFNISSQFPGDYLWQVHSSNDDRVHSATLRNGNTGEYKGCLAYKEATGQLLYYAKLGEFDECQVDKSGRWLLIKENVDAAAGEDNRIIDLSTGTANVLLDQTGAGGHSDNGYNYMLAADNWNPLPGAIRVWQFGQSLTPGSTQGILVYQSTDWSSGIEHVSHANASSSTPLAQQYACGSGASRTSSPRNNEIVCFRLDTSGDVLVVAPVMTDLNASGGGDDYGKQPKGNLDVTGQYFVWTSNMGGSRLDAFIVWVPAQKLTSASPPPPPPPSDTTAPTISAVVAGSLTTSGATITWTTNEASDTQVEYGTTTSYGSSTTLNTSLVTAHSRILSGLAAGTTYNYRVKSRDAAGNLATSGNLTFTTLGGSTSPPVISNVVAINITQNGAKATWNTDVPTDAQVEYGTTTSYGKSTSLTTTMVTAHSRSITGLSAGTTYHYRVKSKNALGILAVSGDYTFKTTGGSSATDTTAPTLSAIAASSITTTGATIAWTTNEASDTQVEYGTTTSYGTSTTLNTSMVTAHSRTLSGLTASTLYHYRVKSRDAAGNLATSTDRTFTTTAGGGVQAVTWTALVNATATGGTVQKTGGCDGCQDAGATSSQKITTANGYLEFTVSETTRLRYVGLDRGNTDTTATGIDYAVRVQGSYAEVRENGTFKWDVPMAVGDVFRIAVVSGVVKYYKNGALFYTSTVAPTLPLQADTSLLSTSATVTNAVISY